MHAPRNTIPFRLPSDYQEILCCKNIMLIMVCCTHLFAYNTSFFRWLRFKTRFFFFIYINAFTTRQSFILESIRGSYTVCEHKSHINCNNNIVS